ncbi:MAG: aminotransferase class I/II-fold pyridoxal phosphate-dependent enzyme [Candidatus Dormiibacterota bacterium]
MDERDSSEKASSSGWMAQPAMNPWSLPSTRVSGFGESVIRDMTRLADLHDAINLAQGFPDFPAPESVKTAAVQAIMENDNQYAPGWGSDRFRDALAAKYKRVYGLDVDPDSEVCVTCGSTEAMIACMLALVSPGDEVIVFEPYYENYGPDSLLAGATLRYVSLREPNWSFDEQELVETFNDRTRAIVLNSPNNPTGKVFTRSELAVIARLCQRFNVVALSDEIYEHITFAGARHIPMATIPGMEDRTVTVSSLSKTYSVTGWRVGWAIAAEPLMASIRKVHDFLTISAPAPFQAAGIVALCMGDGYYAQLARDYTKRRDLLMTILHRNGLGPIEPNGAYYVISDVGAWGRGNGEHVARLLTEGFGVAAVPGSAFYHTPGGGRDQVRFCFSKRIETLIAAGERLDAAAASVGGLHL